MIGKNIENTISECVKDVFRSYGEFGKQIKSKIEEAIQCAGRDIEFPAYNLFIKEAVEKTFIKVLDENAVAHLTGFLEKIIKPVKKDAKVSELLDDIKAACGDDERENGADEIKIEVSENGEGTAIYVEIKTEFAVIKVSFYNFGYDGKDTWHIGYINENGKTMTGRAINVAKASYHKISDILFKYYAMQTEFELDTEFESIDLRDD